MNQPDRYERFVLPEGQKKLEFIKDSKLAFAGTVVIQREDHTMGNLIRMGLHRHTDVVFAGYRIPHPLEAKMVVKVQTNGNQQPDETVEHVLESLKTEFEDIRQQFSEQVAIHKPQSAADMVHDMHIDNSNQQPYGDSYHYSLA